MINSVLAIVFSIPLLYYLARKDKEKFKVPRWAFYSLATVNIIFFVLQPMSMLVFLEIGCALLMLALLVYVFAAKPADWFSSSLALTNPLAALVSIGIYLFLSKAIEGKKPFYFYYSVVFISTAFLISLLPFVRFFV